MDNKIKYLLERYFNGRCTESELQELFSIMNDPEHKEIVQDAIVVMLQDQSEGQEYDEAKWQPVLNKILEVDKVSDEVLPEILLNKSSKVVSLQTRSRLFSWKWMVAASVMIIIVSAFLFKILFHSSQQVFTQNDKAITEKTPKRAHAILTLSDGSEIVLDSAQNGELALQGNIKVIKLDKGQLAYKGNDSNGKIQFNTITTPKGINYKLELPDGTIVWLNAVSSLRFPVAFDEKERNVFLTGEAFFDVAKSANRAFTVHVNETKVHVLATSFNVMGYDDEDVQKTTLISGKVKVASGDGNDVLLSPGQQAQYRTNETPRIKNNVNMEEVLAWKNNIFYFNDASIETIMKQLSRWYNINVQYKGKVNSRFYAEMPRSRDMNLLLNALSQTGNVHFEVHGNNVIVTP